MGVSEPHRNGTTIPSSMLRDKNTRARTNTGESTTSQIANNPRQRNERLRKQGKEGVKDVNLPLLHLFLNLLNVWIVTGAEADFVSNFRIGASIH